MTDTNKAQDAPRGTQTAASSAASGKVSDAPKTPAPRRLELIRAAGDGSGHKRFKTARADVLAWREIDAENRAFLMRTNKGSYFVQYERDRDRATDDIHPVSTDAALELYSLYEHKEVEIGAAFPGRNVEDA